MKYLFIDDEHELYYRMFADAFKTDKYDVKQIPRMKIPKILRPFYKLHFSDRINRHLWLPFKNGWNSYYQLHKYQFEQEEKYCVIFMNGSLKYHFSSRYLKRFKEKHSNVKLVMIMYDSYSNQTANRSISMMPCFDYVFSFDENDCKKHGHEQIYSTFSRPHFLKRDETKKSKAFFVGFGVGRLKILQDSFEQITKSVSGCKFYIAGVKPKYKKEIRDVIYNQTMSYDDELQMSFNTDCIVDIVKEGQSGVSLRTCEAITFNKKLLTNNTNVINMPFYDERYMSVFTNPQDIDLDFIKKDIKVRYEDNDYFSPIKILERLSELETVEREAFL